MKVFYITLNGDDGLLNTEACQVCNLPATCMVDIGPDGRIRSVTDPSDEPLNLLFREVQAGDKIEILDLAEKMGARKAK